MISEAVRSTHSLEVPLSHDGKPLVDGEYIQFLTQIAKQKMEQNLSRIHRFFQNLQAALSTERLHIPDSPSPIPDRGGGQGTNEQNQLHVYKRRQRRQHESDSCPGDGDSNLPDLDDCLDLFT
ncbi:hypothetical protein CRENBAI_000441 [Crenichthys baileyi]|uniref:tRNA wybutosine-synthesizing protein 3 homolog n=1 Tax=Crenichthys baileyi TaxID=28760 RepID=A0AAV9R4U4_9TELE